MNFFPYVVLHLSVVAATFSFVGNCFLKFAEFMFTTSEFVGSIMVNANDETIKLVAGSALDFSNIAQTKSGNVKRGECTLLKFVTERIGVAKNPRQFETRM